MEAFEVNISRLLSQVHTSQVPSTGALGHEWLGGQMLRRQLPGRRAGVRMVLRKALRPLYCVAYSCCPLCVAEFGPTL